MRSPSIISVLIAVLFVFTSHNSKAQLYHRAKNLTSADGLSDNRVTCFHKDKKGFMWIGTRNGLNRYDGHSFKVFYPSPANSISNEIINDIAEDSKGRIWVATMEGLNIYDPVSGNWENMVPDPNLSGNDIPNFIVWDIEIGTDDIVWIASDVFEFSRYNISTKKFTYYDWPDFSGKNSFIDQKRYRSIKRFQKKNEHEFWLGTNVGLVTLDTRSGKFQFLGAGYYGDVIGINYDKNAGKVFMTTENKKLFEYDENKSEYRQIVSVPEPYPSKHFFQPGQKEIWMPAEDGLVKIDDDRKSIRLEKNIPQLSGSLLPGTVQSVYTDQNQIRWIATSNGISIYDPSVKHARFLPLLPVSDREGVNRMGGIHYDEPAQLYFVCSTEPAAVFIINGKTGNIDQQIADANGRNFSSCRAVRKDNQDNIWLLTETNVYCYDRTGGRFHLFETPNKGAAVVFRDLFQDKHGNYWFASFNGTLYFYNSSLKKFTAPKDTSLLNLVSATSFNANNSTDEILIATFGYNVQVHNLSTGSTEKFYETSTTRPYSSLSLINEIGKDAKGQLWLATHSGGIFRYNPGQTFDKKFTQFDMRSGLKNNSIISLCSDNDSTIWLLSGNGLSAMSTNGNFLYELKDQQTFGFSSFSSDNKYPHNLVFDSSKKELLVAVGGGLLVHSLESNDPVLKFPIEITHISTNNGALTASQIGESAGYRLPYRSNAITLEFAGLYYGAAEGIRYEYKLEGYEPDWIKAGSNHKITYQNLPPGSYNFLVRSIDKKDRTVSEHPGFSFSIIPPFWRTWWFIALIVILSLISLGVIIYSLMMNLRFERKISTFATSLYGQKTTDDIFWHTAKNCVENLDLIDCVMYQRDEDRDVLIQKAAYGPKNPFRREIFNPIEIPIGKGIVGTAAATGKPVIVRDTSKDPRYIVDDEKRLSEIAVPIMVDGKVFAVIDSEHHKKNFFGRIHLRALKKMAAICAQSITRYVTEERLRVKIARDMHDEMGSTLTSINIISKVAMEEKQEEEKLKSYFQKIKDHSGRMMESMSDMVWAINPVNDNFEKLVLRMKEFAEEILEPARINYHFSEEKGLELTQLNPEQRKNMYLIFKEALNNTVKYSEAKEMNISFRTRGDLLEMFISDDGKGFDTTIENSGNGLKNMVGRAAEIGGTIRIDSGKGNGTSILLALPSHDVGMD